MQHTHPLVRALGQPWAHWPPGVSTAPPVFSHVLGFMSHSMNAVNVQKSQFGGHRLTCGVAVYPAVTPLPQCVDSRLLAASGS